MVMSKKCSVHKTLMQYEEAVNCFERSIEYDAIAKGKFALHDMILVALVTC